MGKARHSVVGGPWCASAPRAAVAGLAALRSTTGIEVCDPGEGSDDDGVVVWLRGKSLNAQGEQTLRSALGGRLYTARDDEQLVPAGATVPRGHEPDGPWCPLRDYLELVRPASRYPIGLGPLQAASGWVELERGASERPPTLAIMPIATWKAYGQTVPQVRLSRLTFAASAAEVAVQGTPLPAVRAEHYYVEHGVAAPVGFQWRPRLDARVLAQACGLEPGDLLLLRADGNCERIAGDDFVAATRSAIHLLEADRG